MIHSLEIVKCLWAANNFFVCIPSVSLSSMKILCSKMFGYLLFWDVKTSYFLLMSYKIFKHLPNCCSAVLWSMLSIGQIEVISENLMILHYSLLNFLSHESLFIESKFCKHRVSNFRVHSSVTRDASFFCRFLALCCLRSATIFEHGL